MKNDKESEKKIKDQIKINEQLLTKINAFNNEKNNQIMNLKQFMINNES